MGRAEAAGSLVRLRAMGVQDLDRVLAVEVRAYGFPWSRGNFVDSLVAGYLAECLTAPDGSLIGYFLAMQGVVELHLLNLTVAPEHQGRGHARTLLARVVALARARGDEAVLLEVRAGNARARDLYLRNGFTEVGLRRAYYPAASSRREDAVLMRCGVDALGSSSDAPDGRVAASRTASPRTGAPGHCPGHRSGG
jgi:ribosomal-protein-alanine N-acetyltransferase